MTTPADPPAPSHDQDRVDPVFPIQSTSEHPADFRAGLWERLDQVLPVGAFAAIEPTQYEEERARVLAELRGIIMPRPPLEDSLVEQARYEIARLCELIVQGALHQTADLLTIVDAAGFTPDANTRRGQWVRFVHYSLHAAVRAGVDIIKGPDGVALDEMLIDYVLRRLAHELPDAHAVPRDVPATYASLHRDYTQASEAYASYPLRWVDDQTPAAPWLLARASVHSLAPESALAAQHFPPTVVELSEALIDGIDATSTWERIAALIRASNGPT